MPSPVEARITAMEATYNDPTHHGSIAATVTAHNAALTAERGQAALELNGINVRADLQTLITAMDARIAALQTATEAEGDAQKQVAMMRTLAALRLLRQQIVDRETAVAGVTGRVGDAVSSSFNRVDTFTQNNITNSPTGRVIAGTLAGVGIFAVARRVWNWFRGNRGTQGTTTSEAPAPAPTPRAA